MLSRDFKDGLEFAKQMDAQDQLGEMRERFYQIPGEMYMDGNSLGLCSKDAEASLLNLLELWKNEGIKIWNVEDSKYFHYSHLLAELNAPLVNADPEEIVIMGSTTSNIHQALATFYKPTKERYKILVDDLNFPSDRYAIDSIILLKGLDLDDTLKIVKSKDGRTID